MVLYFYGEILPLKQSILHLVKITITNKLLNRSPTTTSINLRLVARAGCPVASGAWEFHTISSNRLPFSQLSNSRLQVTSTTTVKPRLPFTTSFHLITKPDSLFLVSHFLLSFSYHFQTGLLLFSNVSIFL